MIVVAHVGAPPEPHDLWSAWNLQPAIVLSIGLLAWLYARGTESVWRRAGRGRGIHRRHVAAFAGGVGTLLVALVSPVDAVSEALFSVHMTQHLLLVTVAAPLLVLSATQVALVWGLPLRLRRSAARAWNRSTPVVPMRRLLATAPLAFALHLIVVWAWHVPAAYDAAFRLDAVHLAEHVTLLGSALLFWWAMLRPVLGRRRSAGAAVPYLFLMAMGGGLLGSLLTFSRTPWYVAHLTTTRPWGYTPLDDQNLAGVIMWSVGGIGYLGAILWNMLHLLRSAPAEDRALAPAASS